MFSLGRVRHGKFCEELKHPVKNRWVRKRATVRAKKAINSWIGFRTFYKDIFPGMPQKEASTHLKELWYHDPFKAKWAVVTAVYSRIRDFVNTEKAPLGVFLGLICPHVGILPAENYLPMLNWVSSVNKNGITKYEQKITPNLSHLPENIVNMTMSNDEIFQLCVEKGYIDHNVTKKLNEDSISTGLKECKMSRIVLFAMNPRPRSESKVENSDLIRHSQEICDPFIYPDFLNFSFTDEAGDICRESDENPLFSSGEDIQILEDSIFSREHSLSKGRSNYEIPVFSQHLLLNQEF
ncbi:Mating type protein A-1 [Golovinomyces cichoracearum]|uniref:Mating type protein A-1 n=1 Tax=Golovinomyces cichoracearum TaxID=62708 RepID=A0A420IBG2_9PEZI|nr:Mating type protein A-1 [Golovinomyces cichoracearum]